MSLPRYALLASAALATVLPSSAEAQIFGNRAAQRNSAAAVNEIPRCSQSLGTVTISETQNTMFRQMELAHSTEMLRHMIRESGCFSLIERGPGMSVVERERGLGAAGRIRTADFVLVAELSNHIEVSNSDRGSSLLGTLTSYGARAAAAAMTGGTSEILSKGADLLSSNDKKEEPNLDQRTVRAIQDLAKDIRKGDQNAEMVFSLTSVPLAETVSYNRSSAGRRDVRSLRIRDNHFGGRVGGGFESDEAGKIIALSMVRGFADMVISLGGTGSQTPEIVIANREAVRAAESERNQAAQAQADASRREDERRDRIRREEEDRRERLRREEEERIRYEIRREIEAEQARRPSSDRFEVTSNSQTASANLARFMVDRTTVLRLSPAGNPIASVDRGVEVAALGEENEDWIQVRTSQGDGWVLKDRLIGLN